MIALWCFIKKYKEIKELSCGLVRGEFVGKGRVRVTGCYEYMTKDLGHYKAVITLG